MPRKIVGVVAGLVAMAACDDPSAKRARSEPASQPGVSAPAAAPPYPSPGPLGPHEGRKWLLDVSAGLQEHPGKFQVAEARAGDVPIPPRFPWQCRFDHAIVIGSTGGVARSMACSSDGWRTYVELLGGYCTRPQCSMEPGDIDFDLKSDAGTLAIRLGPRTQLDDATHPELP
jgi:hypothetical protein